MIANMHIPTFLNNMRQQINKMIIMITAITMTTTTTITINEVVISVEYTIMYILGHKEQKLRQFIHTYYEVLGCYCGAKYQYLQYIV